MKAIILDTETNGWQKARPGVEDNTPRIIQFAWEIADIEKFEVLKTEKHLIKPDGWAIPKNAFFKDKFSTASNYMYGVPLPQVLDIFVKDLQECDLMVAHNFAFDQRIISAEMKRYGKRSENKPLKICTMASTKELCGLKDKNGRPKVPSLTELFYHIFKQEIVDPHDAGNDVRVLTLCLFELVKKNLIVLQ